MAPQIESQGDGRQEVLRMAYDVFHDKAKIFVLG